MYIILFVLTREDLGRMGITRGCRRPQGIVDSGLPRITRIINHSLPNQTKKTHDAFSVCLPRLSLEPKALADLKCLVINMYNVRKAFMRDYAYHQGLVV